jgi:nicotinate-nucleotide adenylyltransferase
VRLGILGGSFNPPHLGHLLLASYAHAQLDLDLVLLVPAWSPPHKDIADAVPVTTRLDLARLAVAGDERLRVSDVEARLELRYTIDSLRALQKEHDGAEMWFLAGADSLAAFETWRDPRGILELCRLAVAPRSGVTAEEADAVRRDLAGDGERILLLDMPVVDISSTLLRERVRAGLPITYAVPPGVEAAVLARRLYRGPEDLPVPGRGPLATPAGSAALEPDDARPGALRDAGALTVAEADRVMAARVSPKLYAHCARVGRYAAELAQRWGADPQAAELAGILHDYWREADADTVVGRAHELGLEMSELESRRPVQLLHARLAAAELRALGLPEEICTAIARHTVGGPGMSTLEQCVYVADAAEPARSYDGVDELRALAKTSLGAAVAWSNRRGLLQLVEKGRPIHPDSVALYNEGL